MEQKSERGPFSSFSLLCQSFPCPTEPEITATATSKSSRVAKNRVNPTNVRVGAAPSLTGMNPNTLRGAGAVPTCEECAVGVGVLVSAGAPRCSTRVEVGAAVFDIASKGLERVTSAVVACVGVETVSRLDCGRGDKEQNRRSDHRCGFSLRTSLYNVAMPLASS